MQSDVNFPLVLCKPTSQIIQPKFNQCKRFVLHPHFPVIYLTISILGSSTIFGLSLKYTLRFVPSNYTKNSWLLHNETTYLTDWYASPTMRTNPGNKMTKRTMFLTCQLVNGMNDFRFSQVDFIKLLPTVRTFGKRCYICK